MLVAAVQRMSIPVTETPTTPWPKARALSGRKSDQAHDMLKRAILFRRHPPGAPVRKQSLAAEF